MGRGRENRVRTEVNVVRCGALPAALLVIFAAVSIHVSFAPTSAAFPGEPPPAAAVAGDTASPATRASAEADGGPASGADARNDFYGEEDGTGPPTIADPLEPFNRAMYVFNDRLYFWVLKPVAQAYGTVVPEPARVGVSNFFLNATFPVRFVNCMLQADFGRAGVEFERFVINTTFGVAGFLDAASSPYANLKRPPENDLGLTLGHWGIGHGIYLNWPLLGPSSPRDTVGRIGDLFLTPVTYLNPWYLSGGLRVYDRVNGTSLRIGDYESLKEAAIDPYVAIRDAYVQYRLKRIRRPAENAGAAMLEEPRNPAPDRRGR